MLMMLSVLVLSQYELVFNATVWGTCCPIHAYHLQQFVLSDANLALVALQA